MKVSIDLCVVPLGVGVSLSPYIAECQKIIDNSGLDYELGPSGTVIEGEWEEVFACVKSCHEAVHQLGSPRIYTTIKVNTRKDKEQTFRDKINSVKSLLK